MTLQIVIVVAALALLTVGADLLVRGGASLAIKLGLSPLAVGLTVVAFGTSTPELVVSVDAAMANLGAISLGNVVGSNICNVALILGLTALFAPVGVARTLFKFDLPVVFATSIALTIMVWLDGWLGRVEAGILLAGLVAYTFVTLRKGKRERPAEVDTPARYGIWLSLLFVAGGLTALVFGGDLFVNTSTEIAREMGISEAVIGLTLVAVGTSLPELATSLVAAFKKQADIAVGNVIGSNIFNILGILGISATLNPLQSMGVGMTDLLVMCGVLVLVVPLMRTRYQLQRWEGALLLALYVGYVIALIMR